MPSAVEDQAVQPDLLHLEARERIARLQLPPPGSGAPFETTMPLQPLAERQHADQGKPGKVRIAVPPDSPAAVAERQPVRTEQGAGRDGGDRAGQFGRRRSRVRRSGGPHGRRPAPRLPDGGRGANHASCAFHPKKAAIAQSTAMSSGGSLHGFPPSDAAFSSKGAADRPATTIETITVSFPGIGRPGYIPVFA